MVEIRSKCFHERTKVTPEKEHILVIRLGALGDLVFCFQAFHEIRRAHPEAEIALLTRANFADFARSLPWFDRVIIDTHPTFTQPLAWIKLRREIVDFAPTRIYDLQGKNRQTVLYALLGGPLGPDWSGAAPLCKFPRPWPPAPNMHFTDFLAAQLRAAGVPQAAAPDLAWLDAPLERFALPENYAVLIPGCSPDAPHKRWPPKCFAEVAHRLHTRNLSCIVVGTAADAEAVAAIKVIAPEIVDLCGQTSLFELAGILRRAACVIGNDTGPVHMAAVVGAPTLALFSGLSNPVWSKPPGKRVSWRQSPALADLRVDEVFFAFQLLLQHAKNAGR
jgi:ADP-heptose:LPS heptosyltransferase